MKTKKTASKMTKAELIAELAKAEARLAELEEQRIEGDDVFRRLYADSPIMLHSVDVNGVLVNVSNYWLDTLGYQREEVIGRPLGDFFTPASRELDAVEGLPRFIETGIARDEPRQMMTKGGEVLDILLSANAEYDADGRFLFSRAVVKNVTAARTAEEALRKSEQFYSTVTRLSPAGIFRSGADGGCEYVNERWCEIYDMDFADALGDGWTRALHPHDMGEILERWDDAASSNEPYEVEYRIRRRDGSTRWVHVQAIIENNEAGQPVGHIGAVTDITERRSAERTLDRQRILLEAVFRDVPDAMVLANTNREIIMCNAGLSDIFGYTEDEILGQQTSVLYESVEEFEAQGKKRFNLSAEEQREPFVISYRRKDGTLFSGETIGTPVRDQEGNTLGFLGLIRDISGRLESERMLAENEARFRDFGAAAADWYWEMDEKLRFSYFSEQFERFTGVAPHELLGKTRRETGVPGVDNETWQNHLDDLDNHRPFRNFVHSRVMKDGSSVHVSISALPIFDEDGTFKGYRGIGTDITERVALEEMAAEEKTRLLDAIESIDGGVLLLDKDDRFVLCNTQYRSILKNLNDVLVPGTTFEEIIRAVTENEMITDSLDDPEAYIQDRMERHRQRETTVLHNRELDRWIMLREYATSDGGTFLVRTDITDRMQAEEALRQSEERFRRIFEDAAAGMYVFDVERRICQVNDAFCRYVGFSEEELLEMSITDFSPADHQDEYFDRARQLFDGELETVQMERMFIHKNGSIMWGELSASPLRGVEGKPEFILGQVVDVTERRRAEHSLRESEARFRDYAEAVSDWFWETDADLRFTYVSSRLEEITGQDPADTLGTTRRERMAKRELVPDENWTEHLDLLDRHESYSDFRYTFVRPDGSRRVFRNSGKARFDDDGAFLGYRGVGSDITEQVEREEELLRAKEAAEAASLAKSEFLASVSHELRTPITSIKGALGLIQGGVTGSLAPDAEDMVRIAYQNCDRLGILIDDLLDMEKIQAGKMEFSMRPFGVLEMLEDSIEANRGYADGFGVAMQLDHSLGADVRVVGDKVRIIQVMTNLLSNAVKFSPPTDPVRINAKLNGPSVRISVGDEGPGIPAAFHDRVFEAFSQADSSDTRERGGTGLGLTISKAIVDHHGGEIFFETEDGKGTTFHVELPLAST